MNDSLEPNGSSPEPQPRPEPALDNGASYCKRFIAAAVDGILIGLSMVLLFEYLGIVPDPNQTDMQVMLKSMADKVGALTHTQQLFVFLFPYGVFFVLHGYLLAYFGQTIGKRLMGIAIATLDDQKPAFLNLIFNRYLTQWVVGMAPGFGALLRVVDVALIFFTNKRCGHDFLAKTKVIDLSVKTEPRGPNNSFMA